MLVLVIAILSMLALLATTFLVTARYDQIAAGGSALSHQMEMLLSMLEGSIRHVLTQDQWGDDSAHNNPGDADHEAYDAPDDAHAWLKGICGNLIEWEASAGAPDYVQAVTDGENGWKDLGFVTADGMQFRYAMLIQDLGGLINVNVARRPDPDLLVGWTPGDVSSTGVAPRNWPHTIWAFHALGSYDVPRILDPANVLDPDEYGGAPPRPDRYDPRPDWGYWWYSPTARKANGAYWWYWGGMGAYMRGGGPLHNLDLRPLVGSSSDVAKFDLFFRRTENYGRSFDIQDEMDLRFPGLAERGAPQVSMIEIAAGGLFGSSEPSRWNSAGSYGHRRRLVTAIGRTTNWQRRREPILMHPYPQAFWDATEGQAYTDENYYLKFDYAHNDDLIKYFNEAWMGYRMPLQRGIAFSRFVPDVPYDIYSRLDPNGGGNSAFAALCKIEDVPGAWSSHLGGAPYRYWRRAPQYQYDDYLTEWERRDQYPPGRGDWWYRQGPSMAVLLLSNTMAIMGIPPENVDQDTASYAPKAYAHLPREKSDRVRAYRRYVGIMHLNMEDYQDINNIPGVLWPFPYNSSYRVHQWLRFKKYGQRGGAEDRPYISETVMEFEIWPDYCILYPVNSGGMKYLKVVRVDKGSGAEIGAGTEAAPAGLKKNDLITGLRLTPTAVWTPLSNGSHAMLRSRIQNLTPGTRIDLLVRRAGVEMTITSIPLEPAIKTIAVEVYNPHDHPVLLTNRDREQVRDPLWQYVMCVPQDCGAAGRKRALFSLYPIYGGHRYLFSRAVPAGGCVLFFEQRGMFDVESSRGNNVMTWMRSNGLAHMANVDGFVPTNEGGHYDQYSPNHRYADKGQGSNLTSLRPEDGEIVLTMVRQTSTSRTFSYLSDAVRNAGHPGGPPPAPATGTVLPEPAGIADAFAKASDRMSAGNRNPVVRLYRPLYMESRATQYMQASDSWMTGGTPSIAARRLGTRNADEDNGHFSATYGDDYRNVDARGFLITTTNQAFRFGGDLSRVTRLTQPGLKNTLGELAEKESGWFEYDPADGERGRTAPTETVDQVMRKALAEVNALAEKTLASRQVRRLMQKAEARLRFSPYTPATDAELAECKAWYDFLDAFTIGGAAYDNIDNNANAYADEHGTHSFSLGIPPELEENDPGGFWLPEHSNCWPAYGRINVNTAPREVLENCLIAPSATVRRELGDAICDERGEPGTSGYKPFKSLGEFYGRVSVLNGRDGGFDRFGFDGKDNHAGSDKLPDMPPEPYTYIDDLEERNYLWRINSEAITLRSDTFAVYLRFQARRRVNDRWKIISERRVYSLWDRATSLWPARRHDNKLHPDFLPPQRIAIQIFGY